MSWWVWLIIWVVLVIAAVLVLFLQGRSLVRKGIALARELGEASDRLAAVSAAVEARASVDHPDHPSTPDPRGPVEHSAPFDVPAVFDDPLLLRRDRVLARRASHRRAPRRATGTGRR